MNAEHVRAWRDDAYPYRHRNSSETVVVLSGKVKWLFYDDNGNLTNSFIVEAGGNLCGLNVPQGQWHSLESLESGSVIFDAKDGAWEPLAKEDIGSYDVSD